MIRNLIYFAGMVILLFLYACGGEEQKAESGLDLGRNFISAINYGNFKLASRLIDDNDASEAFFHDSLEAVFRQKNSFEKDSLGRSSIRILEVQEQGDTTYLNFQHAYTGMPAQLVVVKKGDDWKVDLANQLKVVQP